MMHRFFLADLASSSSEVQLLGTEAHHATHVRRLRAETEVTILDGAGTEATGRVTSVTRDCVKVAVLERTTVPRAKSAITLLQAVTKPKSMELLVQKATELGVARIVPVLSQRVVSRIEEADGDRRASKWRQVAVEALKQSGNRWLPQIDSPVRLQLLLKQPDSFDLSLLASLAEEAQHGRRCFEDYLRVNSRQPRTIALWVGPEGDFTPEEASQICAAGARLMRLGPSVLRSETAAICGIAILQHELEVH